MSASIAVHVQTEPSPLFLLFLRQVLVLAVDERPNLVGLESLASLVREFRSLGRQA